MSGICGRLKALGTSLATFFRPIRLKDLSRDTATRRLIFACPSLIALLLPRPFHRANASEYRNY